MAIYSLSQEQFDKTNKSLSEALNVEYHHIIVGNQEFELLSTGRGGATKGITGYKYTEKTKELMRLKAKNRLKA